MLLMVESHPILHEPLRSVCPCLLHRSNRAGRWFLSGGSGIVPNRVSCRTPSGLIESATFRHIFSARAVPVNRQAVRHTVSTLSILFLLIVIVCQIVDVYFGLWLEFVRSHVFQQALSELCRCRSGGQVVLEVGAAYQDFAFSYACFEEHAQSPIGEPVSMR